jgi:hypothetical protein
MQDFFHAGVGGFCDGKKLLHSGWKVGSKALLGERCNIFQHKKSGDGYEEDDFNGFQDCVENQPFLEFRVKVAHRITRNHMDVEKLHFPSSSFRISILFSYGSSLWPTSSFLPERFQVPCHKNDPTNSLCHLTTPLYFFTPLNKTGSGNSGAV